MDSVGNPVDSTQKSIVPGDLISMRLDGDSSWFDWGLGIVLGVQDSGTYPGGWVYALWSGRPPMQVMRVNGHNTVVLT